MKSMLLFLLFVPYFSFSVSVDLVNAIEESQISDEFLFSVHGVMRGNLRKKKELRYLKKYKIKNEEIVFRNNKTESEYTVKLLSPRKNTNQLTIILPGVFGGQGGRNMTNLAELIASRGSHTVLFDSSFTQSYYRYSHNYGSDIIRYVKEILKMTNAIEKYKKRSFDISIIGFSFGAFSAPVLSYYIKKFLNKDVKKILLISPPFDVQSSSKDLDTLITQMFSSNETYCNTYKRNLYNAYHVYKTQKNLPHIKYNQEFTKCAKFLFTSTFYRNMKKYLKRINKKNIIGYPLSFVKLYKKTVPKNLVDLYEREGLTKLSYWLDQPLIKRTKLFVISSIDDPINRSFFKMNKFPIDNYQFFEKGGHGGLFFSKFFLEYVVNKWEELD